MLPVCFLPMHSGVQKKYDGGKENVGTYFNYFMRGGVANDLDFPCFGVNNTQK